MIQHQILRAKEGDVPSMLAMGDLLYYGARGMPRSYTPSVCSLAQLNLYLLSAGTKWRLCGTTSKQGCAAAWMVSAERRGCI